MALLRRWLTRPSRVPRPLRGGLAVVLGTIAVLSFAASAIPAAPGSLSAVGGPRLLGRERSSKSPEPPGPGNPSASFPSSPGLITEGYNLYENGCSSCHGISLRGQRGVAPSLIGVGAGPVDFYLSTGRMPLASPRDEPSMTAHSTPSSARMFAAATASCTMRPIATIVQSSPSRSVRATPSGIA